MNYEKNLNLSISNNNINPSNRSFSQDGIQNTNSEMLNQSNSPNTFKPKILPNGQNESCHGIFAALETDHLRKGIDLIEEGDYALAISEFLKATEQNKKDDEACFRLGAAHLIQDQTNEAVPYFKKAIKLNKRHARAYFGLAVASLKLNKLRAAVILVQKVIRIDPEHAVTEIYGEDHLSKKENFHKVFRAVKDAARQFNQNAHRQSDLADTLLKPEAQPQATPNPVNHLKLVRKLYHKRKYHEAKQELQKALQEDPENTKAKILHALASAHLQNSGSEYNSVKQELEDLLKEISELNQTIISKAERSEEEKSEGSFSASSIENLSWTTDSQADSDNEFFGIVNNTVSNTSRVTKNDITAIYVALACIILKEGKIDDALKYFEKARDNDPNNINVVVAWTQALMRIRIYDNVAENFHATTVACSNPDQWIQYWNFVRNACEEIFFMHAKAKLEQPTSLKSNKSLYSDWWMKCMLDYASSF